MLRDPFDLWSSSREVERLRREMNRLFDRPESSLVGATAGYPAMNVWANNEGLIVTAELPGINPDALDISVRDNVLTLTGVRNTVNLQEGDAYHRRERGYGKFQRAFQLPFQIDPEGVEATYEKGVLCITLPRAVADQPRKISVSSA